MWTSYGDTIEWNGKIKSNIMEADEAKFGNLCMDVLKISNKIRFVSVCTGGVDRGSIEGNADGVLITSEGNFLFKNNSTGIYTFEVQTLVPADITFDFKSDTNDGQFKWLEDEDRFGFADDIAPLVDSAEDLGTTALRWRELFVDDITMTTNKWLELTGGTLTGNLTIGTSNDIIIRDTSNTINSAATGQVRFDVGSTLTFRVGNASQLVLTNGLLAAGTDSDVDLGSNVTRFKELFVDDITITNPIQNGGDIAVNTADSTEIASTTTETVFDINPVAWAADSLAVGDMIEIEAGGTVSAEGFTTPSVIFRLKEDGASGTEWSKSGTTSMVGGSTSLWSFIVHGVVRTTGSSGTINWFQTLFKIGSTVKNAVTTLSTDDQTGTLTPTVTVKFSLSAAGTKATLQHFKITRRKPEATFS